MSLTIPICLLYKFVYTYVYIYIVETFIRSYFNMLTFYRLFRLLFHFGRDNYYVTLRLFINFILKRLVSLKITEIFVIPVPGGRVCALFQSFQRTIYLEIELYTKHLFHDLKSYRAGKSFCSSLNRFSVHFRIIGRCHC